MTQFADLKPDMKGRVVAKAWQAIGIPPEHCTDELMAEWIEGLHGLAVDEIAIGVKACQREKRTAHIADFVTLCRLPAVATPAPADLGGCSETREQSYQNCGLERRWGPLP